MAYVSKEDKAKLAPGIKAVLVKYKMKGSISVRNHSSLVVTLQSGAIDFKDYSHGDGYIQVNTYWIDDHYDNNHVARDFLNELLAAMKGPDFFCEDDAHTDYFHRSHYTDINVGKWNKPYFLQEAKKPKTIKVPKTIPTTFTAVSTVEDLARMNSDQRSIFVQELVERFPNMGDDLMTSIGFELMSKEATS